MMMLLEAPFISGDVAHLHYKTLREILVLDREKTKKPQILTWIPGSHLHKIQFSSKKERSDSFGFACVVLNC